MRQVMGLLFLFSLMVTACSPSAEVIQKAIEETKLAEPTDIATETEMPTATVLPTEIATVEPTATATLEPSPTPDVRIIDSDSQNLLCEASDLPKEGGYYMPYGWMTPNTNQEVINARGIDEGKEYMKETGRVTGWLAYYKLGNVAAKLPDLAHCSVYLFKTTEGATLAIEKYNLKDDDGWRKVKDQLDYEGPQSAWVYQKYDTHGRKNSTYVVYFSYKNVMVWIELSSEVDSTNDPRLAVDLANRMLEKLKVEPLVLPEEAILAK